MLVPRFLVPIVLITGLAACQGCAAQTSQQQEALLQQLIKDNADLRADIAATRSEIAEFKGAVNTLIEALPGETTDAVIAKVNANISAARAAAGRKRGQTRFCVDGRVELVPAEESALNSNPMEQASAWGAP